MTFTCYFDVRLYESGQRTGIDAVLNDGQFGESLKRRTEVQHEQIILVIEPQVGMHVRIVCVEMFCRTAERGLESSHHMLIQKSDLVPPNRYNLLPIIAQDCRRRGHGHVPFVMTGDH